jgi:2-oxoisovalerate dehydrogenase E1 component
MALLSWPADAIVVCSFGDASANHSTAAGAINTAINTAYRGLPVPILFVCEDNGLGISVRTPAGWIEHAYGSRPGLDYLAADGADPVTAWPVIMDAVRRVRDHRRPVFLHLRTVRYLAHAGSDAEIGYRKPSEIEAAYDLDPLLGTARAMIDHGASAGQVLAAYDRIGAEVRAEAGRLTGSRQLASAAEIIEPLAPRTPDRVAELAARWAERRSDRPATLAESINATLSVIMDSDRRVIAFGEDVGVKGGVYGVTRGLARRFGAARVTP